MNQTDIDRIKDYCAKATAGPWHYWHDDDWMAMNCYGVTTTPYAGSPEDDHDKFIALTLYQATPLAGAGRHHEDTEFIANARTDLPAAIAEIERLKEQLAERDKSIVAMTGNLQNCQRQNDNLKSQLEQAKAFRDIGRGLET